VPHHVFWVGVTLVDVGPNRAFLVASRERALCDTIVASRGMSARSRCALQTALVDDLHLNIDRLATLDASIVSELALPGLWRSKFHEHVTFYGGAALHVLHGLDRFSEDLDFPVPAPHPGFALARYMAALETELRACGCDVRWAGSPDEMYAASTKGTDPMLLVSSNIGRNVIPGTSPISSIAFMAGLSLTPRRHVVGRASHRRPRWRSSLRRGARLEGRR
jgi:hypothetical protein